MTCDPKKKPIVVLSGPTGSGKSSFVYSHLVNFPFEIIGCDARQIYSFMKIGTASPSADELKKIPHHLYNFLSPADKFSAGDFCRHAKKLIAEIHARQKIPLLLGGTFFYIKSLWDGLVQEPIFSLEQKEFVENLSLVELRFRLLQEDKISYERIQAEDMYRNRRALLLSLAGEKPFSSLTREGGIYADYNFFSFYLNPAREELYRKINRRTELMFQEGFVDEVKELLQRGFSSSSPALSAIGYKEILQVAEIKISVDDKATMSSSNQIHALENLTRDEILQCQNLIAQKTRNYAKRQFTWFNNQPRLRAFSLAQKEIFLQAIEQAKLDMLS